MVSEALVHNQLTHFFWVCGLSPWWEDVAEHPSDSTTPHLMAKERKRKR